MIEQLEEIRAKATAELAGITDAGKLEEWRVAYLGKRSPLTQALRSLGSLPLEERRAAGARANEVKTLLETIFAEKEQAVTATQIAQAMEMGKLDVTLPGRKPETGRLHPTTQILREICDTFAAMGFQVVEGPEVELDRYNFEALNIPPGHPARDMWDTFWIAGREEQGMLLRTHTSPMQIRVMENTRPPVRVITAGKTYRYEATDATHESVFDQLEGLAVDTNITMADLKGTLYEFTKRLFGQDRRVRFRCDYFPFVEPGVEMAIDCFHCRGAGCRICGHSGWIEILGAGMVHPNVLKGVGYDPEVYTGFAFGMGIERILMLRSGIDDIRLFYGNDLRFLRQF